jgi:ADP-ribosylglycohydrolase
MALALARMLVEHGSYNQAKAKVAYISWINSGPFDCGNTIYSSLNEQLDSTSQSNGALMRVSPLGIFCSRYSIADASKWAELDAKITHANPVCVQANILYVRALAVSIKNDLAPDTLYNEILRWAHNLNVSQSLLSVIIAAKNSQPEDYLSQQGWALIAFQNALYQLLHAPTLEDGVIDTVMQGGDTDTNAAICGALLGAVYGIGEVPFRWVDKILECCPKKGKPGVATPRPKCYWPVDVLEIAEKLISI